MAVCNVHPVGRNELLGGRGDSVVAGEAATESR